MDSCDRRVRAYKNGKTFDQCRDVAESLNPVFKKYIEEKDRVLWSEILEKEPIKNSLGIQSMNLLN